MREKWSAVTMAVGGEGESQRVCVCGGGGMKRQRTAKGTRAADEKGLQWDGEATEDWVAGSSGVEAKGAQDQTNAATEGAAFEGFSAERGGSA